MLLADSAFLFSYDNKFVNLAMQLSVDLFFVPTVLESSSLLLCYTAGN